MPARAKPKLVKKQLRALIIDDERSFAHVPVYAKLKAALLASRYTFRVLPRSLAGRWDRALYLNLTHWSPDTGGDILATDRIPADVVAHVAWHHLAARALARPGSRAPTADALFLGESVASAFDLYLVGSLLGRAPKSSFLETQVPPMIDAMNEAGRTDRECTEMLEAVARDPEGAFADLRALLFDTCRALLACASADDALDALSRFESHRFGPLLHRYELSNWVLYARAYGRSAPKRVDPRVATVDRALREEDAPIAWLTRTWLAT